MVGHDQDVGTQTLRAESLDECALLRCLEIPRQQNTTAGRCDRQNTTHGIGGRSSCADGPGDRRIKRMQHIELHAVDLPAHAVVTRLNLGLHGVIGR